MEGRKQKKKRICGGNIISLLQIVWFKSTFQTIIYICIILASEARQNKR